MGKGRVPTHAPPFPMGYQSEEGSRKENGPAQNIWPRQGVCFFFIGEGNGEARGLCQERMNRQPWKSRDKDYCPVLGTAA